MNEQEFADALFVIRDFKKDLARIEDLLVLLISETSVRSGHGTRAGYERHLREGTETCQPCRDANSLHQRQKRLKKNRQNQLGEIL